MTEHKPGWDAQAISRISKDHFGSMELMFEKHGWEERGSKMMTVVQKRVAETYGSIRAFVEKYDGAA